MSSDPATPAEPRTRATSRPKLPGRYRTRAGGLLDLRASSESERLYAAWLIARLEEGARYHDLLIAVTAPGAFALQGKMEVDDEVRQRPLFRLARDVLERAAEREGLRFDEEWAGAYRSVSEVAQAAGVSRAAVVQAIHEARLPAFKFG